MKPIKGCINGQCNAYKLIKYDKEDFYCKRCGQPLQYVCNNCWTVLEDDKHALCIACEAEKSEKREKQIKLIKDGAENVAKVAGVVALAGKNIAGAAKNTDNAVKQVGKVAGKVMDVAKKVKK